MKRLLALAALAALPILAAVEIYGIRDGGSVTVPLGGRLAYVNVLSTVPNGTCTLKRGQSFETNAASVVSFAATNFTYSLVYSNGTVTVTNVTAVNQWPDIAGTRYISYSTNRTVRTWAETNWTPRVALAVTNALTEQITCSGGVGTNAPTGKYVLPGDRLFFDGTAKGRALIVIER